ncbi:MAG: tetratricopeptide repeat protein [Acidobacteriota bacterium]|nr:tetratricopeptide repeat protein [Acidobacteriota bacterium]
MLFAISVIAAGGVSGQMHPGSPIRGEVEHAPGDRVFDLNVELYEQDRHMLVEKAPVAWDGTFELRQAGTGNYEIRLVNQLGNTIRTEYATLNGATPTLRFRLPAEGRNTPGGAVSLSMLKHRENRKAMREFQRAVKADASGDAESSFAHLNQSIALDPGYAPAHNQLGLMLATRGNQESALVEFQKTVQLDPALIIPHANLAVALFRVDRFDEAEAQARAALQLDPNYAKAHYVLALCLIRQHKRTDDALAELRQSSQAFPQARELLEKFEARSVVK